MGSKRSRYQELAHLLTIALISDGALLLLYLIFAIAGILWLKIILIILSLLLSLGGLALLYISRELLRPRSLWLSSGFLSVFLVVLVSLILAFP